MGIIDEIKHETAAQGLNMNQLFKLSGVPHRMISKAFNGKDLRCSTADRLMRALGMNVSKNHLRGATENETEKG